MEKGRGSSGSERMGIMEEKGIRRKKGYRGGKLWERKI